MATKVAGELTDVELQQIMTVIEPRISKTLVLFDLFRKNLKALQGQETNIMQRIRSVEVILKKFRQESFL